MTTSSSDSLRWRYDAEAQLWILTLFGRLRHTSADEMHAAVAELLHRDRQSMVIDASALEVPDNGAASAFVRIVALAAQWPDVLVVICSLDAAVLRQLSQVVDSRLLYSSIGAARAAAQSTVPVVTEDLLPVISAARRARMVVSAACLLWHEPDLSDTAALVASELVTNAAMHACTMMTLHLKLRPCHLYVAVSDGLPAAPVLRHDAKSGPGGRGLLLVEAVTASWGATLLPTGKTVWAALARPEPSPL